MRVLTLLNSLTLGGIEVMLWRAFPKLKERGIHLDFCVSEAGATLEDQFKEAGSKVYQLKKRANPHRGAKELSTLLREQNYDIVHSHYAYTAGAHALAAQRCGLPSIVSFHAATPTALYSWAKKPFLKQLRAGWMGWHRKLILQNASSIVGHSKANLDAFEPSWSGDPRYRVIYNAIDPAPQLDRAACRQRLKLPDGAFYVLHVGSFREVKNHLGLLNIFEQLQKERSDAQLLLVGDGPLRSFIAKEVQRRGLACSVRFLGCLENCWDAYGAADVFVFPSFSEGFANVLLEAQSAGLPVVASDIPGHRESVHSSQQQFLFPLDNPALAAELILKQGPNEPWIASSREYVNSHYSSDRLAADLAALYSDQKS